MGLTSCALDVLFSSFHLFCYQELTFYGGNAGVSFSLLSFLPPPLHLQRFAMMIERVSFDDVVDEMMASEAERFALVIT